jgi:hypothetical protein
MNLIILVSVLVISTTKLFASWPAVWRSSGGPPYVHVPQSLMIDPIDQSLFVVDSGGRLIKMDRSGKILWDKPMIEGFLKGHISSEGTLTVASGNKLAKYNRNGEKLRPHLEIAPHANRVTIDTQGNVYVLWTLPNILAKYNNKFEKEYSLNLPDDLSFIPSYGEGVLPTVDGECYLAAKKALSKIPGDDFFRANVARVIKVDRNGGIKWEKSVKGDYRHTVPAQLGIDPKGSLILAAISKGWDGPRPSPDNHFRDQFIVTKFRPEGSAAWDHPYKEEIEFHESFRPINFLSSGIFFLTYGRETGGTWQFFPDGTPGWKKQGNHGVGVVADKGSLFEGHLESQKIEIVEEDAETQTKLHSVQFNLSSLVGRFKHPVYGDLPPVVGANGVAYAVAHADYLEDPLVECGRPKTSETHFCRYPRFVVLKLEPKG